MLCLLFKSAKYSSYSKTISFDTGTGHAYIKESLISILFKSFEG